MKIKFGSFIVDGRGKIGGHVASKNKSGAYLRTKVTPTNLRSPSQLTVRSRLTHLAQSWRGLTPAQITAWNAAVKDFAKTGIFGDKRNPSGFNLYCELNANLSIISGTALTSPPTTTSVQGIASLSLAAAKGTPALTATFAPAIGADSDVLVFATSGQSNGVNFVKSQFRFIGVLTASDTSPKVLTALYTAKFGAIPPAGQKIFVQLVPVENTTGQKGLAVQASCVVAA